jgi:hypothetical protein
LNNNTTYSAKERGSKVNQQLEAKTYSTGATFRTFLESLPPVLKAQDLLEVAGAVVQAKNLQKPVIAMFGGHVIKFGMAHDTAEFVNMIQHYRPQVNVLHRPVSLGGNAYAITGHHEIMIPLLTATILEFAASKS